MTKEEYKKLIQDYLNKEKKYREYLSLFFTNYRNNVLINKAQKTFNIKEIEKIQKLKKELDLSHEKWYKASINRDPLVD
jgi:hypothetical protein